MNVGMTSFGWMCIAAGIVLLLIIVTGQQLEQAITFAKKGHN
jgi:hypothetical protein